MNIIQIHERVYFYLDRSRTARFYRWQVTQALREAIKLEVDETLGSEMLDPSKPKFFEATQKIRDKLNTIIKSLVIVPTVNNIAYPADYYRLITIECTIAGKVKYSRPTTYGMLGPLKENPFRKPTNLKPYHVENATGYEIQRDATGTFSTSTMMYIKNWAQVSIGQEADLISAGAGVLVNTTAYIATEVSVHNSVTYQPGDQFTSANTNLTSGQVIAVSKITNCDLPIITHESIAKTAASILQGTLKNFDSSAYLEKEASKK